MRRKAPPAALSAVLAVASLLRARAASPSAAPSSAPTATPSEEAHTERDAPDALCARFSCGPFEAKQPCQCNELCRDHGNCCHDFDAVCVGPLPAGASPPGSPAPGEAAPGALAHGEALAPGPTPKPGTGEAARPAAPQGERSADDDLEGAGARPSAHPAPAAKGKQWYDGLAGVKVLHPDDPSAQATVDAIFAEQDGWTGHFNAKRYAVLMMPGTHPAELHIPVTYYTSILGVGQRPEDVVLSNVSSLNGANGQATNNFWRSFEGLTVTNNVTWAVSQGAPIRRSVIKGALKLSDRQGYASGGFVADTTVGGQVRPGVQQQWFFRNTAMTGGVWCPQGWNYVFLGVEGASEDAYIKCRGDVPDKVTHNPVTPRIAEKPYLVAEGGGDRWMVYVPAYNHGPTTGVTKDHVSSASLKLALETEVFVVRPGMDAAAINRGFEGKKGALFTPGIYKLNEPLVVKTSHFVMLGIGFPTLIPVSGKSAIRVEDGLTEVRLAGLLLEAGTPDDEDGPKTQPLLQWGSPKAAQDGPPKLGGVASDIFARVGSFKYQGCPVVRADTMVEINSHDVVLDNMWLWHADHDDCGTDPGNNIQVHGKSDECWTEHGLLVNGNRVTAYGTAVEHIVGGDMVLWNGVDGETYFFQCELPYHNDKASIAGATAYKVAKGVKTHLAQGAGVYIISGNDKVGTAFELPAGANVQNLMTVVIIGDPNRFTHLVCTNGAGDKQQCYKPEVCKPENRCVLTGLPPANPPQTQAAAAVFFERGPGGKPALAGMASGGVSNLLALALLMPALAGVGVSVASLRWRCRHLQLTRSGHVLAAREAPSVEPATSGGLQEALCQE